MHGAGGPAVATTHGPGGDRVFRRTWSGGLVTVRTTYGVTLPSRLLQESTPTQLIENCEFLEDSVELCGVTKEMLNFGSRDESDDRRKGPP